MFDQKPEDAGIEALRMEHFLLPLGMLMAGLVVSTIILLVEIIIHRKTKVTSTPQEETSVAQSTEDNTA